MRRILVDHAVRKGRIKHGGNFRRIEFDKNFSDSVDGHDQILALNEALEKFEIEEPVKAELVKLRYFAGMSLSESASALGLSRATASRYWTYAKSWIYSEIQDSNDSES